MSPKTRSQSLRRRSSRSLPATITAIIVLAMAIAGAWSGITRLTTGQWPSFLGSLNESMTTLAWNNPSVWAASIVLALLGLALLLAALSPGKYNTVRLNGPSGSDAASNETAISRRGLSKIVGAHVDQTDGVDHSSIKVTAKSVDVQVSTQLHEAKGMSQQLKTSLTRKFDDMGISPLPRISVRVHTSND